jgi:hypothetical protein
MNEVLEWSGSIIGMLGAALLASHGPKARFGWLCYLLANIFLIAWSVRVSATGLMVQQLVFSATSVLGLKRSGLLEVLWQNIKNRWACFLARVKSARSED